MRYLTFCSGIGAPEVAFSGLGWDCAGCSEIAKFPAAVHAHRFPGVPNLGDMERITDEQLVRCGDVDLVIAGTPCQSFSVAGEGAGLDDARGQLALVYFSLAGRVGARWLLWENVPGVLGNHGGRDFATILGHLTGQGVGVPPGGWRNAGICHGPAGYGVAWRVLDAQYFGVAQRRRRVLLVGYAGDWRPAAAVLFECESLRGDPAARGKTEATVASLSRNGVGACGADDNQGQAGHLIASPLTGNAYADRAAEENNLIAHALNSNATGRYDGTVETLVTHTLRAEGFDASEDGTGRGIPLVAATLGANYGAKWGCNQDIDEGMSNYPVIVNALTTADGATDNGYGSGVPYFDDGAAVRRLTPRECERLQGFPDEWTMIPSYRTRVKRDEIAEMAAYWGMAPTDPLYVTPDGPRYKAIGNSMAVPVIAWLGRRVAEVEAVV